MTFSRVAADGVQPGGHVPLGGISMTDTAEFARLTGPLRAELLAHFYRMLHRWLKTRPLRGGASAWSHRESSLNLPG